MNIANFFKTIAFLVICSSLFLAFSERESKIEAMNNEIYKNKKSIKTEILEVISINPKGRYDGYLIVKVNIEGSLYYVPSLIKGLGFNYSYYNKKYKNKKINIKYSNYNNQMFVEKTSIGEEYSHCLFRVYGNLRRECFFEKIN